MRTPDTPPRRWTASGARGPATVTLHTASAPDSDRATVTTVTVVGDVDHANVDIVRLALTTARETGCRSTTVHLGAVDFADSTLLQALIDAQREHRAHGALLYLTGPLSVTADRLLDTTGTRTYFTFTTPRTDA
ncbi:STAS domain-containing protein [Streptomyces sp. NPDC015346]|uniref:STAS domain-containing protein n=1 Tax=Streptomyces sp. NPDC015346 TaxID=3364954 RepID=UPI0036F6B2C3